MKSCIVVHSLFVVWLLLATTEAISLRSPVEKVVGLLSQLQEELEQDQKKDQQVYDKYACWCEKATAAKAKAIEGAKTDIKALGQEILSKKGTIATLAAELSKLMEDIKANEEAQAEATSIRQKENAAFMAESGEMMQALAALENAILVLRDATGSASLLQGVQAQGHRRVEMSVQSAAQRLRAVLSTAPALKLASMPRAQLALLRRAASQLARGGTGAGYAPQSATIQGILGSMYTTFSEDLQGMTAAEGDRNREFEDLMQTKQEELTGMQASMNKKEAEKAEAEVMLAEATQSFDDTTRQMHADIDFFDTSKAACETKSQEWQQRKSLREEELGAVSEALTILKSDDARELFADAMGPGGDSFLQVFSAGSTEGGEGSIAAHHAQGAYRKLQEAAKRSGSLRLARLAVSIRSATAGHFAEVIASIDTMLAELKREAGEDVEKRDQCKQEYAKIKSTVSDLEWKVERSTARVDKLESLIAKRKEEKDTTIKDIGDVKEQIKDMKQERNATNQAFLKAKVDDEEAINLLEAAKEAMAKYYEKHAKSLLQQGPEFQKSEFQAPEAKFSKAGHRKNQGKGIMSLLSVLIEDLQQEISEGIKEEESAQISFEKSLKAAKKLLQELETKETNLDEAIADRSVDKNDEEKRLTGHEESLGAEQEYKKEISGDCDFIIERFAERREKREAEQAGLTQAREFLAGYHPQESGEALVQSDRRIIGASSRPLLRAGRT